MPGAANSEEIPLAGRASLPEQAETDVPNLTVSQWEELWMDSEAESEKTAQQSVFSARSGIQDLLVRPDAADAVECAPTGKENVEASAAEPVEQPDSNDKKDKKKSKRQLERVRRRQMNYLHERRKQKKRQVMFGRIRVLVKLCMAFLLGIFLWELMNSPFWLFKNPDFSLQSARMIQPAQVAPFVTPWAGKPIYAVDTGKLARQIKARYDIIDRVAVRRHMFPNRLEIFISEKQPWAEIYADIKPPAKPKALPQAKPETKADAKPVAKPTPKPAAKPIKPYGLIVQGGMIGLDHYAYQPGLVRGLDKVMLTPHGKYTLGFMERLHEITWQAHQIKGLHLLNVDARNPNLIILNFQEMPVVLGRLDRNASERLARLIPLLGKINELHDVMESVDLRWEEQVTFHKDPRVKFELAEPEEEGH